ncbi:MAG: DUF4160 domain-containing protein [Thermodesulfobacteriota bacterium]
MITIEIQAGTVGAQFPKRALQAVLDWLDEHQEQLLENWRRPEQRSALTPIAPLE